MMLRFRLAATGAALLLAVSIEVPAFCGFYVARAEASLFNEASQVVIARDGPRTVVTMASDYRGDVADFAMVIPVPDLIRREQVNVGRAEDVAHLDRYTAPRLVEYHDADPCRQVYLRSQSGSDIMMLNAAPAAKAERASALGVRIEARYTVEEYDILILSATQSDGLVTWLQENDYRLPDGAAEVVDSYLKRDMRFFVAKVNLEAHAKSHSTRLRPLQIAYESKRFVLPIRLGMLNAQGHQELFVYTLTRHGRVETTNYRTVRLPSDQNVPVEVKQRFSDFYTAMFAHQAERENHRAVFLEYAWDMGWCDPCAADPLSAAQLRDLGAIWVPANQRGPQRNVFVTRLHLRYDAHGFPEDLMLHETRDRSLFQGRYVLRHAYDGPSRCEAAEHYFEETLPRRRAQERETLARLTGWTSNEIADFAPSSNLAGPSLRPWWERLWSTNDSR